MGIRAEIEGNLTKSPEMRVVNVKGENRRICELRVFCDANRLVDGQWQQDDSRSCAVDVTIWNEALGERVMNLFRTGARVLITGDLHLHEYDDDDGQHHAHLRMAADAIGLQPWRVEAVTFAQRRDREAAGQPA